MATLYDVAREAGVSKTLVSRTINHQPGVSPENRKKIEAVMKKLQYTPNEVARSLVLQKTNTIGVVLDSLCEPYYFDFIRGVESGVDDTGLEALFCSGRELSCRKDRMIEFFSQGRVDGIIIYGSDADDISLIRRLAKRTFPFVIVENEADVPGINSIVVDNVSGGEMAVEHLIERGCKNIWHFTGNMKKTISKSRKQGYLNVMKKNGLPVMPQMVIECGFTEEQGYRAMKQCLKTWSGNLPDGIFFAADVTAVGAIRALQEAQIQVPEQIKIVGFDNDIYCTMGKGIPELTTLCQPLQEMGRAAVNMLRSTIQNPSEERKNMLFSPKLIVRESSLDA